MPRSPLHFWPIFSSVGGASASDILRFVFVHSIALAMLVGVLVMLQATIFPGVVPSGGRPMNP